MSGHNKWSTIKQKKGKNDAARAKVFTKIGRELIVAIKDGGSADPSVNSKLKDCIAKAKAANVPNDNIERIIKKASSDADSTNYEAVTYEGYGPNGVAVIVEALTDNEDGVVILCNKGYDGRCFRKGYNLKMCQENMFYACEYTGYTKDYCENPC